MAHLQERRAPEQDLRDADWRDFFEERAAIAEYDGGADRATAERRAFETCVARWLDLNPPSDGPDRCAYSGDALPRNGGDAVAMLRGGGYVCVRPPHLAAWRARRRAEAAAALAAMGMLAPEDAPCTSNP